MGQYDIQWLLLYRAYSLVTALISFYARGSSSGDAGGLGDIRSKDDDRLALLEMGSIGQEGLKVAPN